MNTVEEPTLHFGAYYLLACAASTPPHIVGWLTKHEDPRIVKEAIKNPNCPFTIQFLNYLALDYVRGCKISETPYAVERREDFMQMLENYNLTVEEIDAMPYEWVVALLK